VAAVRYTISIKTAGARRQQDTNWQGSHAQITGHGDDNGEGTMLIAHVVLYDHTRVQAGHLMTGGRGKVE
jgi:hypothetical protein